MVRLSRCFQIVWISFVAGKDRVGGRGRKVGAVGAPDGWAPGASRRGPPAAEPPFRSRSQSPPWPPTAPTESVSSPSNRQRRANTWVALAVTPELLVNPSTSPRSCASCAAMSLASSSWAAVRLSSRFLLACHGAALSGWQRWLRQPGCFLPPRAPASACRGPARGCKSRVILRVH